MKLHFLFTGGKFHYAYYLGAMTALRAQRANVVLWYVGEPPPDPYFEVLKSEVETGDVLQRLGISMPEFPALEGKDDHFKRVTHFDFLIWLIARQEGGSILGLDSVTLRDFHDLLEPGKEMLVPLSVPNIRDNTQPFSMHAVTVRRESELATKVCNLAYGNLHRIPADFYWGDAGIRPFNKVALENLDKVSIANYGVLGGHHSGIQYFYKEDGELITPNARTLPLCATATAEQFGQIDEEHVEHSGSLYARLVRQILTEEERHPLGAVQSTALACVPAPVPAPDLHQEWEEAQKWEREWWGDCLNTLGEEQKQLVYAEKMGLQFTARRGIPYYIDMQGKSVLDIGGGPASLLLKCINVSAGAVVDPLDFPEWTRTRYRCAGIKHAQVRAEDACMIWRGGWDEVWLYNVLAHVEDPDLVLRIARGAGEILRIFEWIDTQTSAGHPHSFTRGWFESRLGAGTVETLPHGQVKGTAFYGVFKRQQDPGGTGLAQLTEVRDTLRDLVERTEPVHPVVWPDGDDDKMRFHIFGLAHTQTTKEYGACAYTMKIYKLCKMLSDLGHTVYHYGVEGSMPPGENTRHVDCLTLKEQREVYGDYDWRSEFFKHDGRDAAYTLLNERAGKQILRRAHKKDFVLFPMGNYNKPAYDIIGESKTIAVESGIGYRGVFLKRRVFESYAWMHYLYGILGQNDGTWYDAVIPNYFDLDDFEFRDSEDKEDWFLYMGRLVLRKGLKTAVQVTKELGAKLVIAGQGSLINPTESLHITDSHVEHIGHADVEMRKSLMSRAKALFAPTWYIEPFGGVAVEAQLSGTPVITTDWGAFTETVEHGVTGYRCRTLDDFVWAAQHVGDLKPKDCREWAERNYSMERVGLMYEEYFRKLLDLWKEGWPELHPEREQLDWLRKYRIGG